LQQKINIFSQISPFLSQFSQFFKQLFGFITSLICTIAGWLAQVYLCPAWDLQSVHQMNIHSTKQQSGALLLCVSSGTKPLRFPA
jgi:hypothetical protein